MPRRKGQPLGDVEPDEQRTGEARAMGDRDRVEVAQVNAGLAQGFLERRDDGAQVRP